MADRPLAMPLYQRVFGILSQRIRDGSYAPGEQLPSIDALCAEFNVSRGTIRQAIGELAARELLVSKQGRGTYISEHGMQDTKMASAGSFADLILFTRDLPLRDVRVDRDQVIPPRLRKLLGTDKTSGTVIRRTREINDRVFAYTVQYLSPAVDHIFDAEEWERLGLLTLLHNHGVVLSSADQSMSAQLADVEVAQRLEIDLGAPVLYGERVLHSDTGPIEVVCAWYSGDVFEWHTTLDVSHVDDKIVISVRTDVDVPVAADESSRASL